MLSVIGFITLPDSLIGKVEKGKPLAEGEVRQFLGHPAFGARLISKIPRMGPIIGVGYGVGVYDFELVKKSLASLGSAVGISLATSALYFALSPLTGEQSELLARTSPTIWDVQIALAGGLAGIIGLTRKEKSNVIPGVAIATALMPPLCTAGFGLASGNWRYFLGAFYLFTINSVFIALAAVSMKSA